MSNAIGGWHMQVLVNSDHHIVGTEALTQRVEQVVHAAVDHFGERITRVEVHLNDVNSHKLGEADKRCMMEARVGGLKPIAVSHQAASLPEAIDAAADKLVRALERTLGRLEDTPGRTPSDAEIASVDVLQRLEDAESARPQSPSGSREP
jgi:ribosome-associated translation inhibitor RaiA